MASWPPCRTTIPAIRARLARCWSNVLANFIGRPAFIAYTNRPKPLLVQLADAKGALRVVWTARDEADARRVQHENDMVIFEFYEPAVKYK